MALSKISQRILFTALVLMMSNAAHAEDRLNCYIESAVSLSKTNHRMSFDHTGGSLVLPNDRTIRNASVLRTFVLGLRNQKSYRAYAGEAIAFIPSVFAQILIGPGIEVVDEHPNSFDIVLLEYAPNTIEPGMSDYIFSMGWAASIYSSDDGWKGEVSLRVGRRVYKKEVSLLTNGREMALEVNLEDDGNKQVLPLMQGFTGNLELYHAKLICKVTSASETVKKYSRARQ